MEFVIARNPDESSSLPYLLRLPVGPHGIALKARDTWPRTNKVYCHRAEWPAEALDVVERVPVRSCVRRGAAIDLVLARSRAWTFRRQQATTRRGALPAGDYAVMEDDAVVASVERKSLADLVSTLTTGKLRYLLADLATVPRAAVVVEDRWSSVFKLERASPSVVAGGLAEAQVRFPTVPIVFCETRPLAEEWAYRFLGAALARRLEELHGSERAAALDPSTCSEG